jgi:hypothetical protein
MSFDRLPKITMLVGSSLAFAIFALFGSELFPPAPGPEFQVNWDRVIAVVLVSVFGGAMGLMIGLGVKWMLSDE